MDESAASFPLIDLATKIRVILSQSDSRNIYRSLDEGACAKLHAEHRFETIVYERPLVRLCSEQVELLKALYASSTPEEQAAFVPTMFKLLDTQNAATVAQMVVELRAAATLRNWTRTDNVGAAFWKGITWKLQAEHWTFSDEDLAHVTAGMGSLLRAGGTNALGTRFLREFAETVDRVEYLRLAKRLRNIENPVIDADRQVLLSRLETLGFSGRLADALREVERKGSAAAAPIEFKSAMDLLRTFFEEFVEEAAQLVEAKSGVSIPATGNFVPFKDHLRNQKVITTDEHTLLQNLYNYLSNAGTHVLGSAPEQWHVAKVMVVEVAMMIAGRVQALPTTVA